MLNKHMYKFMTTKQLSKRVDKIKIELEKTEGFDKRLNLLEDLAVITGVLLRRCRHDIKVVDYTMKKLDEMTALVK